MVITDDASMQQMFCIYQQTRFQEEDNDDSEKEFEANYKVDDENDDRDLAANPAMPNEAHAVINQQPFGVPSFMQTLDLEAMHAPEFPEYANMGEGNVAAECLIRKKACWEIRRYNGKHTCTMGMISHDHTKLDSDTIVDAIRTLVEADSLINVKSIIAKLQSRFNYTINYYKAWLAKQKYVVKVFGGWEVSYQTLPVWLKAMTAKIPRTEQEYNKNYQRLRERGEAYTQWCDEIGVQRWVLAFDRGHRWGHMTANLVECINSVLKGARNLPVTAIVRSTFYRLNELVTRKSTEAHEHVRNGFTYSEFATKRVEESFRRAGNVVVNRFDRRNEMFEVREMQDGSIHTVNLVQRHCDYGHFQMSEICKVYRGEFVPMGDPSTWAPYEGAKVIANWTLRRATKGRPKSTRYFNEMDSRDMCRPRWCTICGREGHSQSRCPQRAGRAQLPNVVVVPERAAHMPAPDNDAHTLAS
ncbi:hypothetical protein Ahy_A04g019159 [Arachis hypogaea]|uniref:CCHC-type domain-containing protein n=1 Tax=Arachis hypogaea TaxID=3818 RepID=A0A445DFE8_ARAHY|nr:hypothetical protein Ahy_A04g019159 [Arachis hypogaea]